MAVKGHKKSLKQSQMARRPCFRHPCSTSFLKTLFWVLQVQFDEREDTKVCTIVINDDKVFEGIQSFHVELSMPVYALLGANTRAVVNINDTEDEPTLQFDKKTYHVNESSGFFSAPIERKGRESKNND